MQHIEDAVHHGGTRETNAKSSLLCVPGYKLYPMLLCVYCEPHASNCRPSYITLYTKLHIATHCTPSFTVYTYHATYRTPSYFLYLFQSLFLYFFVSILKSLYKFLNISQQILCFLKYFRKKLVSVLLALLQSLNA
jgi:hypothetical protein